MKRLSITSLKRKYPKLVRAANAKYDAANARYDDYCVGGALCLEVGIERYFPGEMDIRAAVLKANPRISLDADSDVGVYLFLRDSIKGIIQANDAGNFKLAWKLLGKVLRWPRP